MGRGQRGDGAHEEALVPVFPNRRLIKQASLEVCRLMKKRKKEKRSSRDIHICIVHTETIVVIYTTYYFGCLCHPDTLLMLPVILVL